MALKEATVCPAGHPQTYARSDRPGSCTRCGAPLQVTKYDDALPKGRIVTSRGGTPQLVLDEETDEVVP